MSEDEKLGLTGRFPHGRGLRSDDDGEARIGIRTDPQHNVIYVEFGVPILWLGFDPKTAKELAAKLLIAATRLEATVN